MNVKELKKELSKLSGIDFFNPKYRDVFRKYFPNDSTENDFNDNEEDRVKEVLGEEVEEQEMPLEESSSEEENEIESEDKDVDNEDIEVENTEAESAENQERFAEENLEKESEVISQEQNNISKELLEMKVELGLVRAGVREDRLNAAKKLFLSEINSLEDLDKLEGLIEQFPEWLNQTKQVAQPFGIPLGDYSDGLSEEEKRLKAMGINPRV